MDPALRTSASGMVAQQLRVDAIANNLANVNTTGFKRSRVSFEDVLYETLQGARIVNLQGTDTVAPVQIGQGVRVSAIIRIHEQGAPEITQRPLDLAIEGEGLFQVLRPDGSVGYTRDGSFSISDSGTIVTNGGYTLLPGVAVPNDTTSINISGTGIISATVDGGTDTVELGRIELARFMNPSGLLALGENLLAETPASGPPILGFAQEDGFGRVLQGMLEGSNVQIVQEMVDMISAQRAYEVNARAIRTVEEMLQTVTDRLVR